MTENRDGPGRPRKSLPEHVEDRSFRAERHEQLLLDDDAPLSEPLRSIRTRYRRAKRPQMRERAVREFERVVRAGVGAEISLELLLFSSLGPIEREFPSESAYLGAWYLWGAWALPHGLAWRLSKGHPDNVDLVKLDKRFGQGSNLPAEIRGRLAELAEAFWHDYGDEPVPEPPNVQLYDRQELEAIGRRIKPRVKAWERKQHAASR
jgi:hypothetical protein